ncbi:hypothetical protein B0181_06335 [Moraxella caviae]|uniref:Outer membrane lipoprotein n=1 Tax=Moraxella caviae TaxID=34060 RepID=A0A1T0A1M6_9GAMM|nr:BON domain-containing protein [Moraxella caviae]OOR89587.1 hypothetical protein B0181_06335 [Moraxella caviae]STZ10268.1 outer membrane lipoprotein [Moraxella caviae]VEW11259.1 outer membrane lipoprotein [Moraxella caviae]
MNFFTTSLYKKLALPAVLLTAMAGLTACATTGAGENANFGAPVMSRTIPERISDESIELTARKNLSRIEGVNENSVRIAIDSFRREVLLTGEVPSEAVKLAVQNMVGSMKDVTAVYNYLTVADTPKSQSHTMHEGYLKSKIAARLLANKSVRASQYKVIVRDQTAYVMGYLTPTQQGHILDAIQNTPGMAAAVTLTTLVSDEGAQLGTDDVMNENMAAPANDSVVYGGTSSGADDYVATQPDTEPYVMQEIYTPNAPTNAPTNAAPVYANPNPAVSPANPAAGGTSSYVELYQGTNSP